MPATAKKKTFNFESGLQELGELVTQLEQGKLSLEDALTTFERGIVLVRECQAALSTAEQRVQILSQQHGQPTLEDYPTDDES